MTFCGCLSQLYLFGVLLGSQEWCGWHSRSLPLSRADNASLWGVPAYTSELRVTLLRIKAVGHTPCVCLTVGHRHHRPKYEILCRLLFRSHTEARSPTHHPDRQHPLCRAHVRPAPPHSTPSHTPTEIPMAVFSTAVEWLVALACGCGCGCGWVRCVLCGDLCNLTLPTLQHERSRSPTPTHTPLRAGQYPRFDELLYSIHALMFHPCGPSLAPPWHNQAVVCVGVCSCDFIWT
jgi:hypothetical protein